MVKNRINVVSNETFERIVSNYLVDEIFNVTNLLSKMVNCIIRFV